jgi:hypothetical protein
MKVLGISIEANKAIFTSLEKDENQKVKEIVNTPKKIELKEHLNAEEVRTFLSELHSFLGDHSFDKVGIITRGTKGRFAASPISFKIEGLIQIFPEMNVDFIAPATLRAFYKKNENPVESKYTYQKEACDLAFFLLNN